MATYSRTWDDSDPPGSQAASTIDNELRDLRADIAERMDDLIEDGQNWNGSTADLRQKDAKITGQRSFFHWSFGSIAQNSTSITNQGWRADPVNGSLVFLNSVVLGSATLIVRMPLLVQVGAVLQSVNARIERIDATSSITLKVFRTNMLGVPVDTQLGATATSAVTTGWHTITVGALAHAVLVDAVYTAEIVMTESAPGAQGDTSFLGIDLLYDLADLSQRF